MQRNLRKKSNQLFAQIIAIGAAIILLLGGLFYKIYNYAFSSVGEFALNKAHAMCGCKTFISNTHATLFGVIVFAGAAIAITTLVALFRIVFFVLKTKKFIKGQQFTKAKISAKLTQIASIIGISDRVEEVESESPTIFCHGIRRPKIRISSAVINFLTFSELRAVLLHETQHLISREPARLLVIKFINTFRFIPGIKNLTKKYLSFSELAADELATNNFTEKNNLARAMRKILELEEKNVIQKGLALSYFSQVTEERVLALSDNGYRPTFKREILKACFSVAVAAAFFFYFSSEIQAQTNHTRELYKNSQCVVQEHATETCKNGWTNCQDKVFHEKNASCKNIIKYIDTLKN
ncbi:MAG: M56 family metallopeptidase [Patescibacteria group bacterium]